jgi:alpha-galactosidase
MSIMCLAAARASSANVVGLCHSVQAASHSLAEWAGISYHDMTWTCAGVNHLAWFTRVEYEGRDLYSVIKERYRKEEEFRNHDVIRKDLMMHFGYYCTESSGHDSEYLPYYRKNKSVMKRYCRDGYGGGSRFYATNWPKWRKNTDNHRRELIEGKAEISTGRSWEYASYIIQAMETNDSCVIYGNVPNRGLITNLPDDGVVEVPCLVDKSGIRGTPYGRLPAQCAALCDWNMRMFDLAADACITKSIETAAHALMLDPLTAAVSCPADIRKMTYELFKAEKAFLPGFKT